MRNGRCCHLLLQLLTMSDEVTKNSMYEECSATVPLGSLFIFQAKFAHAVQLEGSTSPMRCAGCLRHADSLRTQHLPCVVLAAVTECRIMTMARQGKCLTRSLVHAQHGGARLHSNDTVQKLPVPSNTRMRCWCKPLHSVLMGC